MRALHGPLLAIVLTSTISACTDHRVVKHATTADDARALLALTHRVFEALRAHDVAAFDAMLAPEFVARALGAAETSRAAFLEGVRALPNGIASVVGEELDVRIYSDTAVVMGVQRATVRVDARDVVDAVAFTDVFVRRDGTWRLSLSFSVPAPPR